MRRASPGPLAEGELWRAAEVLRGAVDAGTYHHLVLALLLLRDPGALSVPDDARWAALIAGEPESLAARLDAALARLEAANPSLAGALPPRFVAAGLDGARLARLAGVVARVLPRDPAPQLSPAGPPGDVLGRAYEYYLAGFSRDAGRGGEFYTPACVADLLAAVAPPRGVVYDPCCGTGGLFVHAPGAARYVGQESNPTTWRLARANLARRGLAADLGARPADSLLDDLHAGVLADAVLANPPFNMVPPALDPGDARWAAGVPAAANANLLWLQHALAHLAPGGHGAVVLALGALTGRRAGEGAVRDALVAGGRIEGVVALPAQLFHSTSIPAAVWLLGPGRDELLFVDATGLGRMVSRTRRVLDAADVQRVGAVVARWRAGAPVDEPGFARAVPRAELGRPAQLAPGRYVGAAVAAEPAPTRTVDDVLAALDAAVAGAAAADVALGDALRAVRTAAP